MLRRWDRHKLWRWLSPPEAHHPKRKERGDASPLKSSYKFCLFQRSRISDVTSVSSPLPPDAHTGCRGGLAPTTMDLVATACGVDRAVVRLANLVPATAMPFTSLTGHIYDSGDHPKAMRMALDAVGYTDFAAERDRAAAQGRLLGIGFACYVEYTAINSRAFAARGMRAIPGFDSAYVSLQSDGVVHLWTTLPAIGQGTETTFAQLAADALGVPFAGIVVHKVDTGVGNLEGTGVFSSRSAVAGGGAIASACGELRRRILSDAAERLEASVDDVEMGGGGVQIAGVPQVFMTLGELASRAPPERYQVAESFDPPAASYPYGTHACVVEIDAATGEVRLLRYVIVDDCGTLLNPRIVEGQVHCAVAQGIAGALYEAIRYSDIGQPQTATLMDYSVPKAGDLPNLTLLHLTTKSPHTPHGIKGAGEGGTVAPGAAIANAISDALGGECNELPATPPHVFDLMRHARLRSSSPSHPDPNRAASAATLRG